LICASTTACATACGTNNATGDLNCTPTSPSGGPTNFWCNGVGAGACVATLATGGTCNRNAQCANGTCSGSCN
jgi:hypothetical protein